MEKKLQIFVVPTLLSFVVCMDTYVVNIVVCGCIAYRLVYVPLRVFEKPYETIEPHMELHRVSHWRLLLKPSARPPANCSVLYDLLTRSGRDFRIETLCRDWARSASCIVFYIEGPEEPWRINTKFLRSVVRCSLPICPSESIRCIGCNSWNISEHKGVAPRSDLLLRPKSVLCECRVPQILDK